MRANILLSSDLDRTILPNGAQPESPQARPKLAQLAKRPEVMLAYVSGRHKELIQQAITEYRIPKPDYAIGDVGTTIYAIRDDKWAPWREWIEAIAPNWAGATNEDLRDLFKDLDTLRLQEAEKQNTFKLSYYTDVSIRREALLEEMHSRLSKENVKASLIWSVDEEANLGLLDVLPESATKLHAILFLMEQKNLLPQKTVFSGDSGNDLPVVTSGELQSVLVKNAHPEVIEAAVNSLTEKNAQDKLYVARGDFLEMNGNYSAGVLEGLVHYIPEVMPWLE